MRFSLVTVSERALNVNTVARLVIGFYFLWLMHTLSLSLSISLSLCLFFFDVFYLR